MHTHTNRETRAGLRQDFGNPNPNPWERPTETHAHPPTPGGGACVCLCLPDSGKDSRMQAVHSLCQRLSRLEVMTSAIRARNWRVMWPNGEDAPPTPEKVAMFEDIHGPAPASALRVLEALEDDTGADGVTDAAAGRVGAGRGAYKNFT